MHNIYVIDYMAERIYNRVVVVIAAVVVVYIIMVFDCDNFLSKSDIIVLLNTACIE